MSRSPAAARVMLNKTAAERWGYRLKIRSAGIGSVIAEAPADAEVVEVAAKRHYDLGGHKRRQFFAADLRRADLVIAMNRANRRDILKLAATEPQRKKVHLLGSFSPLSFPVEIEDHSGYGRVRVNEMLRQIEAGCDGLITQLTHELNTRR